MADQIVAFEFTQIHVENMEIYNNDRLCRTMFDALSHDKMLISYPPDHVPGYSIIPTSVFERNFEVVESLGYAHGLIVRRK